MVARATIVVLVIAVFCGVLAPTVMAQQFQRPTPDESVAQLDKALNLTAEQEAQLLKIFADAASSGRGGGRGGFRGGRSNAAVEGVLTEAQVTKYRAYILQQSIERRIAQIDRAVTLTEDQKKKIIPIIEKEIIAQTKLMAGLQQGGDRQGMMEKLRPIREATATALKDILTAEQMTRYSEMRGFGGGRRGQ